MSKIAGTDHGIAMMKALNSGFVKEETLAFGLLPGKEDVVVNAASLAPSTTRRNGDDHAKLVGRVKVMGVESLETAVWRLGGATLLLEVVTLANVSVTGHCSPPGKVSYPQLPRPKRTFRTRYRF